MTPDELPFLLRASHTDSSERGPACPDEHSIAAYVDGTLGPDDREPLELHLADCSHCLALVGLLGRANAVTESHSIPAGLIDRARMLAQPRSRHWGFSAPRWAAAATVVLAVGALVHLSVPPGTTDASWRSDAPATRTAASHNLQLLSPREGMAVDRNELTVRWSTVPGARYYDVRVVTEAGDVVAEESVTGNEWRPRDSTTLRPGLEYFVHVDAYVSEAKAISSGHVLFHVSD